MGTVGLSFGSPTSGAGFDVSTTVSQIVANLQNVETPWKNQLSALQSQDAVISNLGTLFSNLSSDLSQLTDFQGILAQKLGSSSDTNILQLTSASSSATAGTHSVVVNSLAQTASGYLTAISNASDTLSGSITLQVGSGAAKTITLNSTNNTLAGLAAAINASGAGITASVLTDASGSRLSLVSGTSGANGNITVSANSIVDTGNGSTALSYTSAVTGANASLTVDGVALTSASNTVNNLIPGVTFQLLSASANPVQVVIGNDNTDVESAVNKFVADYNSLISALNTQEGKTSTGTPEPLFGSPTLSLLQQSLLSGLNVQNPNGYLDSISASAGTTLSGSFTIQVGNGTAQTVVIGAAPVPPAANTIYTGSGVNTLAGLADAINAADIGVTAGVATSSGQSTLTLASQTAGSGGDLIVTSALTAITPAALTFLDSGYTGTTADSGTLGTIAAAGDTLIGSLTIQVSNGQAQTITLDSSDNTLSGMMNAINAANLGVTAALNSDGTALTFTSNTTGSAGALAITSNIADTSNVTSAALNYTASSNISNLTGLGISVNNDGSLTFDASTLDSLLNSDFNGVVGFFQNANSWGQNFAQILNNAGSGSSTGILSLAAKSNSTIESGLNAQISREDSYISAQQARLTTELNKANEILQALPSQLASVNEIYSAITGYNQNK
ncbi:MAG TPA: flagellar filament capping protein FliD [Terracidiphilus sp.]|nr:flagellar filament capping protein FliD [Terracidiphilus sp.]